MPAPESATTFDEIAAVTADGVRLAIRRFRPEGEVRAACLVTHAMMANSRYLWPMCGHLASQGIDCFALDFRGHGNSVPPEPEGPHSWCFDDYVELDLPAAMAAVREASGASRVGYLGHSLGGLVGLAAFGSGTTPSPSTLALIATSVWLPGRRGSLQRRALMQLYRASALPLGYAPVQALGLGTDNEPRTYIEQLASWALGGRWISRTGVDYMSMLREIDCPALAICGEGDSWCDARDADVLRERLTGALPLRRVGKKFGDPLDPDHFALVKRPELARMWTELAEFIGSG